MREGSKREAMNPGGVRPEGREPGTEGARPNTVGMTTSPAEVALLLAEAQRKHVAFAVRELVSAIETAWKRNEAVTEMHMSLANSHLRQAGFEVPHG